MRRLLLLLAIGATFLAACGKPAPEKRYKLQGEVISADASRKILIVKHGEISGLMPAMTMSYMVAEPKEIVKLQPGDKISAELVVSEDKGRLEKIVLIEKANSKSSTP